MIVFKIYSIVMISLLLISAICLIKKDKSAILSAVLLIPILIYLMMR